ncbi:transposase [Haloechinothrix sp. YIM 98757]|uniref:Mutator family transposase n=1 Tax=Haloechinothrix aidingensis TaxID=2752311 RepID=A0A838ABX7_9PSEU|nr:transposase [Haloechinothrix aidingensis]
MRDLLVKISKSSQPWVATLVRTIFDQPDADQVHAQYDRVIAALQDTLPTAADHLAGAREDLLAFTALPRSVRRQVWSSNPQERLHREQRRRSDVVGIFPDRDAITRLLRAVQMEHNDEWTGYRRYTSIETLTTVDAPTATDAEELKTIEPLSA